MRILVFGVQILILAAVGIGLWQTIAHFPYPSPLIKPFLSPEQRWPAQQIREWVEEGTVDPAFMEFFLRDPPRTIPQGENIVAPADGEVIEIAEKRKTRYIVIALSVWDVHVQRHPADGKVVKVRKRGDQFMDGEGRNFAFLREKLAPVQKVVTYDTAWGHIRVRLVTSFLARRVEVWSTAGDGAQKGDKLGRILLGSTVVLEIPATMEVLVAEGERVTAGETIVAR